SLYTYQKANNRNVFEEMFNSYYSLLSLHPVDKMPQIKPLTKNEYEREDLELNYKNNIVNEKNAIHIYKYNTKEKISIVKLILVSNKVYLNITYNYDMYTANIVNYVGFHGENVPTTEDKQKQTQELLKKYNISKEYLQKKSDELLDTVLTDWKNYSGSSYSKNNMGKFTIEKDEFLK
ncbi:TipC family immunity protein, partial [Gemella cuniculi]|uniref:TipC family immunity protein n=1 Tax=Gemella cuniculi TaxID=150240 RepID=UPI0004849B70